VASSGCAPTGINVSRIPAPHQSRWRAIDPRLEVIVSLNRGLVTSVATWAGVVLIALSARGSFGAGPITWSEYAAWLFLATAPIVLAVVVGRGMSTPTIAQVLYDAERDDTAFGRPPRAALPPLSAHDLTGTDSSRTR
jgi:hypothetical protein